MHFQVDVIFLNIQKKNNFTTTALQIYVWSLNQIQCLLSDSIIIPFICSN